MAMKISISCRNFAIHVTSSVCLVRLDAPCPQTEKTSPPGVPSGPCAVQLAVFSALNRSLSAATSLFISVIITVSSFSHSSTVSAQMSRVRFVPLERHQFSYPESCGQFQKERLVVTFVPGLDE